MEKNIFENAKFGDKFLTRDGRIAIYVRLDDNPFRSINDLVTGHNEIRHELFTEYDLKIRTPSSVDINGQRYKDCKSEYDIVSRYKEPSIQSIVDEKGPDEPEIKENHIFKIGDKVITPDGNIDTIKRILTISAQTSTYSKWYQLDELKPFNDDIAENLIIKERAEKKYNVSLSQEIITFNQNLAQAYKEGATDQDPISRADERKKCIEKAYNIFHSLLFDMNIDIDFNKEDFKQAMEENR